MLDRMQKIMLVECDSALVEIVAGSISRRFDVQVTCAADAEACLDVELLEPHDLAIIDLDSEASDNWQLVENLTALSARPIMLMANDPDYEDAVEGMRMGVRDFFRKPFPVEEMLESVDRALHAIDIKRRHLSRYHRMRELVRHVISERRSLNQRIDLVCRDLVQAQRRLVHRVRSLEEAPQNH